MASQEEKFLMFYLDEEHYGIPILKVNEIIGLMEITHIPKTPEFIKGIINLRGKIIPIMDLRLKFEMPERAYDEQTCIIIVEMFINDKKKFIGVVVDKVAEVVNVYESDIELPPQYGQDECNNFLTGVGKVKDKVVMLLDIEAIINYNDIVHFLPKDAHETIAPQEPLKSQAVKKEAAKEETETDDFFANALETVVAEEQAVELKK